MSRLMNSPEDTDILTNYPFPIAFEYALLKAMMESGRPQDDKCEQLRTVMWFASRYLSVLTLSTYFRMDSPDLQFSQSDTVNEHLEEEIKARRQHIHALLQVALSSEQRKPLHPHERPRELGLWLDIVFKISDFWKFIGATPFVPEIIDWASEHKGDPDDLSYWYDSYSVLPSHTPSSVDSYFVDAYSHTKKYLETISFVKKYPLVKVEKSELSPIRKAANEPQFTWIVRFLMGQAIQAERKSYDAYEDCPKSDWRLLSVMNTRDRYNPRLLPLVPLSVFATHLPARRDSDGDESIALIDDSVEKGLRYRLNSLDRNIIPTYVTLDQYLDLLNDLLKDSLKVKRAVLPPDAGWQEVQKYILRQNTENRNRIGEQKYHEGQYLERTIDHELWSFLASGQQGMLIVGDAGVGKTNLLCRWSAILETKKETIVLLYDCRDFAVELQPRDVDQRLARVLGARFQEGESAPLEKVLTRLGATRPPDESAQIVFLFDALNEHPEAEKLLEVLAGYLVSTKMPPWLKVVITCRREHWERSLKYSFPSSSIPLFYHFGNGGEPIVIAQFTDEEAKEAYTEKYKLKPEFSTLPEPLQKLLEDPLMLGLVYQVYKEHEIPFDLNQNTILREYIRTLVPTPSDGRGEQQFLTELLRLMYENKRTEVTLAEANQNPVLQEVYSSRVLLPNNPYLQLISDLLRDSGTAGTAVTFRYERVFEFALAEYILKTEAEMVGWSVEWFATKVKESNEYPTLWGALRSLLVEYLGDSKKCDYQTIQSFARYELYELGKLLAETLVILSASPEFSSMIRDSLNELVNPKTRSIDSADSFMGEVAISVARRLGWADVFENGTRSPLIIVRIASVQAIYYVWRRNKKDGVELMARIASLVKDELMSSLFRLGATLLERRLSAVKDELMSSLFRLGATLLKRRLSPRSGRNPSNPLNLLPLTSSFLSLSMMVLSHCLREPETSTDLYRIWKPIFDAIPKPLEGLFEGFVSKSGAQLLISSMGGATKPDGTKTERSKETGQVISVRTLKAFVDLPLGHEYRLKAVRYLEECDPAHGRLDKILDEVVQLARIPDAILHFVVEILFLTRAHQSADDVLEICQKLCDSEEPYDVYEGTTKMGVYLYSIDNPPASHMRFMESQALWIWQDSIKRFQLAGGYFVLDQLRYPIMYECSPIGGNRSRGQIEFVHKVRQLPWRDNAVDRDIAIIRALGEAAVFGHVTYNIHVIPILETLQLWFRSTNAQAPDASGDYFRMTVSEAIAEALSRIRAIYPDEVERYLSFASARLRELVGKGREESAASVIFTGGQASLPWLFTRPVFRNAWLRALIRIAKEATDMEQVAQMVADETFKFQVLRAILADE